jgi:hypothetical protein
MMMKVRIGGSFVDVPAIPGPPGPQGPQGPANPDVPWTAVHGPYELLIPQIATSLGFASVNTAPITPLIGVAASKLVVVGSILDVASQNWPPYLVWGWEWNSTTGVLTIDITNQWSGATGPANQSAWRGEIHQYP